MHEPKGVSTALAGQVYRANGSGSGTWRFPSGHAYGELYITSGTTPQTLSAASATAKLNPTGEWTANGNSNVTIIPANGTITVLSNGEFQFNFWITFTTDAVAAAGAYYFHYAVNGVASPRKVFITKKTNSADVLHCSANGFAALSANDVISIYVGGNATSSSSDIVVNEAGLSLSLMQPT